MPITLPQDEWICGECEFSGSFDELAAHCLARRHDSGRMTFTRPGLRRLLPELLRQVQDRLGRLPEDGANLHDSVPVLGEQQKSSMGELLETDGNGVGAQFHDSRAQSECEAEDVDKDQTHRLPGFQLLSSESEGEEKMPEKKSKTASRASEPQDTRSEIGEEEKTADGEGATLHACPHCSTVFSSGSHLARHELHCSMKMVAWKCPRCDASFNNRTLLKAHDRRSHGVRRFLCSVCPKVEIKPVYRIR